MRQFRLLGGLALLCLTLTHATDHRQPDILRWAEGQAGCTFSADDDGKYRYGLWTDDFGIVIAVDADEVRKASLRIESLFAIFLAARYRGKDALAVDPAQMSLEFVKHFHAEQSAVDPDNFAAKLEDKSQKADKQSALRVQQSDVKQTQEFLRSRSLRPIRLDPTNPEARGWVFFSAKSKWIGDWKKQEQFVLHVPVAGQVVEFPFALPPSQGDLPLRRR